KCETQIGRRIQFGNRKLEINITCNLEHISNTSAIGAQSPKFLSTNCLPPPRALKNSIPRS
ncbi:hypothetical protein LINPERPRIM_LOCUS28213, partial [Linum perenne]